MLKLSTVTASDYYRTVFKVRFFVFPRRAVKLLV